MTSRNAFDAFAVARGEGLHPKLRELFDRTAAGRLSELVVRSDGMLQAGPNPASDALALPSNAPTPVEVVTKTPFVIRSIREGKSHPAQE